MKDIRCENCRRRFGGWFAFRRHRPLTWDRCRTVPEMRAIGLRRNRRGLWVRRAPTFQRQFDYRSGSRVRLWFGKPYRALSFLERQAYRRRLAVQNLSGGLAGAQGAGMGESGLSEGPRNAQRGSPGAEGEA